MLDRLFSANYLKPVSGRNLGKTAQVLRAEPGKQEAKWTGEVLMKGWEDRQKAGADADWNWIVSQDTGVEMWWRLLKQPVPLSFRPWRLVSWGGVSARRFPRHSQWSNNEIGWEILYAPCRREGDPYYQHQSYRRYWICPHWKHSE